MILFCLCRILIAMKRKRPQVKINLGELDQILDQACERPIDKNESEKVKTALHALAQYLEHRRSSEKTAAVTPKPEENAPEPTPPLEKKPGHGRTPASDFTGAVKVTVAHETLHRGDVCPGCQVGKVYPQKEPTPLVRMTGQAPIAATVYELERLRCNGCGQMFTAEAPVEAGPEKFDEASMAMIAVLKYGTGMPLYRISKLQASLGIPLAPATQWDVIEEAAELLQPARDELMREAAQGELLHNDDTSMRVLKLNRPEGDQRTGVFTTGLVSAGERRVALFFTGRQHAGENLMDVLRKRAADLPPPIVMCDALTRNVPKGVNVLLANCNAHGRRQFVEVADNFPPECRFVLETLGEVYGFDAAARERGLGPAERLAFHQERSAPLMAGLRNWCDRQLGERLVEPNSGLGKAIRYLQNHWEKLTLFLRQAGAPLDNNICEQALKRVVLHRKNALFYRTLHGAEVGDLCMSLIHSCALNGVNPFEYLRELLRHPLELKAAPGQWMPWNFRETAAGVAG